MIGIKVVLLILGFLLSGALYSIAFAILTMAIHRARATGLPALLYDPVYWLFLILILGGETWLAIRKVKW